MLGFRFLNFLIFTLVYGVSYLYQTWGKTPNEKKELQGQILSDYLISMGPIYIKIGQILATRSDLISDTIAEKLRRLQDNDHSMNEADTKKIIERGLKQPFETVFQDFSFRPVASASIAQVHQAELKTGKKVAVKIVKKNVRRDLQENLKVMGFVVKIVDRLIPSVKSLNLPIRFRELSRLLIAQTDFIQEAEKQSRIYLNFKNHPYVKVPLLVSELCTNDLLVMEFIEGIPGKESYRCHLSPQQLARRFQETIYTMLYLDGI
ncbi:MAG: AarF/ABC1/UbiB kinase family protein, partial [Chroococcales cyanobacterium metabat2.561]